MAVPVQRSIDLSRITLGPELFKLLSIDFMKRHSVVPFEQHEKRISIAMVDALNTEVINQIRVMSGFEPDVFSAPAEIIQKILQKNSEKKIPTMTSNEFAAQPGSDGTIPQLVDKLFEMALKNRASDIHLEPQVDSLFVRFRIDGTLHTVHEVAKELVPSLISRIKVMAGMDITEKRLPQDGQIGTTVQGKPLELRVSTLPAKYGEKTVIRLLDKSGGVLDLASFGMDALTQSQFEMLIEKPQGLILVTGPTGSGKSTTLYAVVVRLKSPFKNIITLEDPIEYELLGTGKKEAGITQVQIHTKAGLTFATGLRASLRQDPDIIMVGEIRDHETAEVCMKAAMTGHLVISTLHTNDAPSAIGRLRDIGVEPFLIASTLAGVMAQRLVRLLCPQCKQAYEPPMRAMQNLFPKKNITEIVKLYRPKGCDHCQGTGYWGRKGIYELLTMQDSIRSLIHENASGERIKEAAVANGMKTLRESGLDLVFDGLTTVEEVFRHTVD